jgi:poly-gamma-glutamate capsule biosynthesis protein CapA/YwtB (metallophosphatase superfamily)
LCKGKADKRRQIQIHFTMNPQKTATAASGGRKNKVQKDVNNSTSEQNNNVQTTKHINTNVKDSVNNNIVDSQPKTEKEKTHAKVK